jgi:hypothetical protein
VYLVWGLVFLALGLLFAWDGWLVARLDVAWDGWLPRRAVLERHPSPDDSFYLFNQIMAVVVLSASGICGYIHHVVK